MTKTMTPARYVIALDTAPLVRFWAGTTWTDHPTRARRYKSEASAWRVARAQAKMARVVAVGGVEVAS